MNAVISREEDGPPVPLSFRFLPEETVYLRFEVAEFAAVPSEDRDTSSIDLKYSVAFQDAKGVALAPVTRDEVSTEVGKEDKNWLPKRRAQVTIPAFAPAGTYQAVIVVRDQITKLETTVPVPFRVGGESVSASDTLTVQRFRFLRSEDSTEALDVAAYAPGDTVYAKFDVTGFAVDAKHTYRISYDLNVTGPDGKSYLSGTKLETLTNSTFYPAAFLPVSFNVQTKPDGKKGVYVVKLTLHDEIGNTAAEYSQAFSLE